MKAISMLLLVGCLAGLVYFSTGFEASSLRAFREFDECFENEVLRTQQCSNKDVLYVPNWLITNVGLGSIFNFYLLRAFTYAVAKGKRMIYLDSHLEFEYDCKSKDGWACYLSFKRCPDGVLDIKDIGTKISQEDVKSNLWTFMPPASSSIPESNPDHAAALSDDHLLELARRGNGCANVFVPNPVYRATLVGTKFLYHYTGSFQQQLDSLNLPLGRLLREKATIPYAALQVRLTDKKNEVSEDVWNWMQQTDKIVAVTLDSMKRHNLTRLYISTDDCSVVGRLRTAFQNHAGFNINIKNIFAGCQIRQKASLARQYSELHGAVTFADLEMMRHAKVLIGMMLSRFVRMAHRIRYPDELHTFMLAPELMTFNNLVNQTSFGFE